MNTINQDTLNTIDLKLDLLRKQFPEIFEDSKLNIDKLKSIIDKKKLSSNEKFEFNWAGKNEIGDILRSPSSASLKFDKENSLNLENTENLLIEGDNLEVLKLLQKSYFGKVKMIYIDPPYNTGNGFVYNDNFKDNLKKYLVDTNQIDDDGNNTNLKQDRIGRNHSNWLNFMYPRLSIARNLLKEDGVIFISIDDNEVHHLKMICNEIFGEENFVAEHVWRKTVGGKSQGKISTQHEYILCFAKNYNLLNINELKLPEHLIKKYIYEDKRGKYDLRELSQGKGLSYGDSLSYEIEAPDGSIIPAPPLNKAYRWKREKWIWGIKNNYVEIKKVKNRWVPFAKQYLTFDNEGNKIERGESPNSWLDEKGYSRTGTKNFEDLVGESIFSYPKPILLIKHFLEIGSNSTDIILDFFAGSGTTGHAVMNLNKEDNGNRKFILVQYPEKTDEKSVAKKEGYNTIFEITQARLEKAIEKNNYNSGFKTFRLCDSNYKKWNEVFNQKTRQEKTKTLLNQINQFESSLIVNFKVEEVLYEIILKEGFTLNCEINIKKIGKNNFYEINEDDMKIYLNLDNKLNENTIVELKKLNGENVFLLDESLDDNSKINLEKYVNLIII